MKRRVVVTGIGILCSIGTNKKEVLNSLLEGTIGLKESSICKKNDELQDYKVGECDFFTHEMKDINSVERLELMAVQAIDEALIDSSLEVDEIEKKGDKVSLSISTSLAGSTQTLKSLIEKEKSGLWCLHSREFISRIMSKYKFKGSCYTTSSACAAGTAGAGIGYDLIKNDEADIVIVGGADHLSEFPLFGFHSLKSLSNDVCKPFDVNRDGINIGEASAFFVFEELGHALERGAKNYYGEIMGYALANDAYHMTSPNPSGEGAFYVMKDALKNSEVGIEDIDCINAHGTGTKANDKMEIKAIRKLFDENTCVSSTKSRTGHCLGAAGSVELAICLLSLDANYFTSTLNSKEIIEDAKNLLKRKDLDIEFKCILSNSFAFGGNLASIVIKR